jgi:hypothetical protein
MIFLDLETGDAATILSQIFSLLDLSGTVRNLWCFKKCSKTGSITSMEEELETFEVSQREIIEFDGITIQILQHSR